MTAELTNNKCVFVYEKFGSKNGVGRAKEGREHLLERGTSTVYIN